MEEKGAEQIRKEKKITKSKRGGCRRGKKRTDTGEQKLDDQELSEGASSEGGNEFDLAPVSAQKKPKIDTLGEPGLTAKGKIGPGKGMKLMFRPNIVVRGKPTIAAGSDGQPQRYWQKESKGPLQKVAAQLGLKRVPTMHEYIKYVEKDVLKVPSWTLPLRHDDL